MPARAIWKGEIHCGGLRVPVRLYSAVIDQTIRFHLLHDQDKVRLKLRMRNPNTDEILEYSAAQRGYEIERGLFVILDEKDLESLDPPASRDIEITRFVAPTAINHPLYDRPYYLAPDGDGVDEYFALVEALDQEKKVGIANWVMRKKEYVGALHTVDGHLMLITLRHVEEVLRATDLESPGGAKPTAKEVQLAEQLVSALAGKFRPEEYRDDYRDRVMKLIESKRRGKRIKLKKYKPEKPKAKSLAKLLEASLAGSK
jgi:DNA end-binding protein Ku